MTHRLVWKLLFVNVLPVIAVIIAVIWLAFDNLAADYFMTLMERYDVSPVDSHQMFLSAVHRYLVWAALSSFGLATLLSFLLTSRVLRPLAQMTVITREYAKGNFSERVEVSVKDEVGELGLAFNRMADSLARLELLRKTMVADVAHELRTPLTNLRGYFEALTDEVIPPERTTLEMLKQETLHLVNLVENLQQLARADAARALLVREQVDLPMVLRQMLELYRPQYASRKIDVSMDIPGEAAIHVSCDREKLLQAIRNLLENAWKYTNENGSLCIRVEPDRRGVKVRFVNTGEGIGESDLPFIFERFFRADRSRSRQFGETAGAGIGLAIVKELIEAHDGTVGASSAKGVSDIWFWLPSAENGATS